MKVTISYEIEIHSGITPRELRAALDELPFSVADQRAWMRSYTGDTTPGNEDRFYLRWEVEQETKTPLKDLDWNDNRECECGHPAQRHWFVDEYGGDDYIISCKYCRCYEFHEKGT